MDRKRIVTIVVVSAAIIAVWFGLNVLLQKWHPEWYRESQQTTQTPATSGSAPATSPTSGPTLTATSQPAITPPPPATQPAPGEFRASGAPSGQEWVLGHEAFDKEGKSDWPLGIRLNPYGAGVESATLNRYRAVVGKDEPYVFQTPDWKAHSYQRIALAARSIRIDGGDWTDISEVFWRLEPNPMRDSAAYSVDILSGEGAAARKVLTITKTYKLRKKTDKGQGFEFSLDYSFVSHDEKKHTIQLSFTGPNLPPVENLRDTPEIVVGYDDSGKSGKYIAFDHFSGSDFRPRAYRKSLTDSRKRPILWGGVTSAYFDAIVLGPRLDEFADFRAEAVGEADELSAQEYIVLTFVSNEMTLEGVNSKAEMPLEVFLGPRERELLRNDYYSAFPRQYNETIVIKAKGFFGRICAACTWGWLIDFLVLVLNGFHWLFGGFAKHGDWGLAIIVLVLIVRLLLHPITKRSQVSMQKMTKLGPEIEKLKKKHGDNKEELQKATMELYKQQGFTPILGCLPMLLQMPIWIALWTALQGTFELRHSSFLWGFTWIKDLAQPDRLWDFHKAYKFWFFHVDAINLLPILMGVVFWLQQKMTPKPASETPEQAQQRKIMQWMSLLFPLILYNGPAGLNLYILASTAIGIWESKRVRDHIKAQEEAQTAGKVIVDARPTRGAKRHAREDEPQKKPGCMAGWLADLQKKAEQMRQEADRKKKPRR